MIEVAQLSKTYRLGNQEVYALREVSFNISKGELVSIMGPSGSGKSTLMNLLGCLDLPSGGSYHLANIDVQSLKANELAEVRNKQIGFVFQNFNLLPRATALENVELPLLYGRIPQSRIKALDSLDKVGLRDRAKHRPNELSGGERQRVAIARAIVNNPSIILADEPTGNLDSKTGVEILNSFKQLNAEGATIILVTHDPSVSDQCPRTLFMMDGCLSKDERKPVSEVHGC